jgi:hypothetical protein
MTPRELAKLTPALFEWLEALCEDRLSSADAQRLEQLVLRDSIARQAYLAYLDLHGTLHWNIAFGDDGVNFEPAIAPRLVSESFTESPTQRGHRRLLALAASVAVIAAFSFSIGRWFVPNDDLATVAGRDEPKSSLSHVRNMNERVAAQDYRDDSLPNKPFVLTERPKPDNIAVAASSEGSNLKTSHQPENVAANDSRPQRPAGNAVAKTAGSVQGVVAVINEHLAAGWKVQGVEPSPPADDAEWLRRIYLNVVGHIPPVDVAEKFLTNRDSRKREKLLDVLLDDPAYVRNWTIVWTNLLIGRSDSRDVNRPALQKFLRESFAKNRPWSEMVAEFISAEGSFDQNGATNFLLAHLNNQAVPATAITAKIFLGQQIGCTQCHDHPFNDWKQDAFWSFNSFFQQTKVARVDRSDATTGKMKSQASALETKPVSGPTHFENRRGLALVAYPKFEGTAISEDAETNRRNELAKLMTKGDKPQVAEAFVNRMWDHFFGYGFTRPVDDMGPHNPPSHPELLDHLAREFVASGYDCKQLIRWICLSDAYQRSSRFGKLNESDNPETGASPLFSRVYVKGMTVEQLYDSLLLATGADNTPLATGDHDRRRHELMQQFVHAFQTDENDESINFESSITQALLMMNSDLTQRALSMDRGTFLEKLTNSRDPEAEKIKRLCLATLTRYPTPKEQQALRRLVHEGTGSRTNSGWQDALWAYLNSSEFVLVH